MLLGRGIGLAGGDRAADDRTCGKAADQCAGAAAMIAVGLAPQVRDYLFAGHRSAEPGHSVMLAWLGLEPLLDRKLDDLDPIERTLLRMGAFELEHRLDVPYKVVINEEVALAKKFGATDSHKYVNGVLDKVARELRKAEIDAAS